MKKIYSFFISACAVIFVIIMASFGGGDNGFKYPTGAPAGYTNSPGDGQNCSHCMGGTAVAVSDWIFSDIPVTGYVPGEIYSITVTATGTGNKGFELSPQSLAGDLIGTLFQGPDSKLVGGDKYITHNAASTIDPKSWTFLWTAPTPGVGDITFYACAAVGKLNTKTTTMVVNQNTVGLSELNATAVKVYPNPVQDQVHLSYNLDQSGMVLVDLLSVTGRNVAPMINDMRQAGENLEVLQVDLSSGIYLLRIQMDGKSEVRKMVVQ